MRDPYDCLLCEGEGYVAKNFSIDSWPERPTVVPCPVRNFDPVRDGREPVE